MESSDVKEIKHHKQQEYCVTRPAYRQGKNLTAVKVNLITSCNFWLKLYCTFLGIYYI